MDIMMGVCPIVILVNRVQMTRWLWMMMIMMNGVGGEAQMGGCIDQCLEGLEGEVKKTKTAFLGRWRSRYITDDWMELDALGGPFRKSIWVGTCKFPLVYREPVLLLLISRYGIYVS